MDSALTTKKGEQHRKCIAVPIAHFEKELTGPELKNVFWNGVKMMWDFDEKKEDGTSNTNLFRIRVVASISDGGATNRSFINAHFPVDRSQGTTDISNEPALSRTFVLHLGSSPPCEEAAKQPLQ
eukprot:GEZU01027480.1.p4 GENE.GEZU01027480.1~~GEZU01027480.1.p4  ORF type:complete len:125 (+),score=25.54 GEZU01027480.1:1604-1978(+)